CLWNHPLFGKVPVYDGFSYLLSYYCKGLQRVSFLVCNRYAITDIRQTDERRTSSHLLR
ncbi:predicted protein, partial [Phaeodactylum tricornutum CCAP 1055/1]